MTRQLKAAALTFGVALTFVVLQLGFDVQTGLAGLFVMGMAAGLLIGDCMVRDVMKAQESARR